MDYKRFLELFKEFDKFIISLNTLYLDSVAGFNLLHQRLLGHQNQIKSFIGECEEASSEFQDECGIDCSQLYGNDDYAVYMSPYMKQGDVKNRTAHDGMNYILMGRLCVVQAYTYWETYLRKEVAIALGVLDTRVHTTQKEIDVILRKHVSENFWGDMATMRHGILHKNGIATSEFEKMKVLTWFKPDDDIELDFAKMRFIFCQLWDYRNKLYSLSLPPFRGKLPSKRC